MNFKITLLPGDGIGPEVVAEAVRVLDVIASKYKHTFNFQERLMGGCSIDKYGSSLTDEALAAKVGASKFFSATYRLFKLDSLEPMCEDYGQAVIYKGGLENAGDTFVLDKHHAIECGKVFPVCGNTWRMLKDTRFAPYFELIGNFDTHYGIFADCGTTIPYATTANGSPAAGGCC